MVGRLTPPEREALYRFEPYLLLPGLRSTRCKARLTFLEKAEERERSYDLRADLRSRRFRIPWWQEFPLQALVRWLLGPGRFRPPVALWPRV